MKILFDQGTSVPLRAFLEGHEIHTLFEKGWDRLTNGDVIAAAILNGYDVWSQQIRTFGISTTCGNSGSASWCS